MKTTLTRNQAVKDYTGYACLGLFNPKGPENVGAIMRAAGWYGVNSVFYTGKRYARAQEFATDTKMIHQDIPLIGIDDLQKIVPLGCTPMAVEPIEAPPPPQESTPRDPPHPGTGAGVGTGRRMTSPRKSVCAPARISDLLRSWAFRERRSASSSAGRRPRRPPCRPCTTRTAEG